MVVKNIFWNSEEYRVRAGWRILSQLILMAAFTNAIVFADNLLMDYLPSNPSSSKFSFFQPLEVFLAIFLSMFIIAKYFDKRPFRDFGFNIDKKWFADFGAGLLIGIVLMSGIFMFEYYAGWITITDQFHSSNNEYSFIYGMMSGGFMFIFVGFYEEMQVRGYLLKNLSEGFNFKKDSKRGALIAVLLTSLLFGLSHAANPNATLISTLSISLAGILLAAGYLVSGRLAIPIGLHISWNFFQGYVYGFSVSGNNIPTSIFVIKQGGPEIWTGGAFGPEAGLIGVFTYFAGMALIYVWVKHQNKKVSIVEEIGEYKIPGSNKLEETEV